MAGPTYNAGSTASDTTGTAVSLTVNAPTGIDGSLGVAGDTMIMVLHNKAASGAISNPILPSGWAVILPLNVNVHQSVLVAMKVAGTNEPASYTVSWTTASAAWLGIVSYAGCGRVPVVTGVGYGEYQPQGVGGVSAAPQVAYQWYGGTAVIAPAATSTVANTMYVVFVANVIGSDATLNASLTARNTTGDGGCQFGEIAEATAQSNGPWSSVVTTSPLNIGITIVLQPAIAAGAPVLEGGTTASAGPATALTLTPPGTGGSEVPGFILLWAVYVPSCTSASIVIPGANVGDTPLVVLGTTNHAAWGYKLITGNETTWSITWTTSSNYAYATVSLGCASFCAPEASAGQENASSLSITAPTVTPKWTNDMLISMFMTNTAHAITVPVAESAYAGLESHTVMGVNVAYLQLSTNSATGTEVASCGTAAVNFGVNFVLRAPTVGGTLLPAGSCAQINPLLNNNAAISGTGALELIGFGPGIGWSFDGQVISGTPNLSLLANANQLVGQVSYIGNGVINPAAGNPAPGNSFFGTGYIEGTCYSSGFPYAGVLVTLTPQASPGQIIEYAYTNSDGTYRFNYLAAGYYLVTGCDTSGTYNDVAEAWVLVTALN